MIKIVPAQIHEHYKNGKKEICGRVICHYGFVGIEVKEKLNERLKQREAREQLVSSKKETKSDKAVLLSMFTQSRREQETT